MLPHAKMQSAVDDYIRAYNARDVEGMLEHLDPQISFRNVSRGEVTLEVCGLEAFRETAEQAREIFTSRCMTPLGYHFDIDLTSVLVDFSGVLAVDLPGGPAAGETLHLRGESVFTFDDDRIVDIEDRSLDNQAFS